jgi:hypothetical protein
MVPVVEPPFGMLEGLKVSDERPGPHPDPVFGVSSNSVPYPIEPPWFVVPQRLPRGSITIVDLEYCPLGPLKVARLVNRPADEYSQTTPSPDVPP